MRSSSPRATHITPRRRSRTRSFAACMTWRGSSASTHLVCCPCPWVQWCAEQEITVTLLDRSGAVLATLTPEAKVDVLVRRRQYLAASTGQDVVIARELVCRKLERQRATLHTHPELPGAARAIEVLEQALSWLALSTPPPWLGSLSMLRTYEGRAASAYFGAWAGLPLRWAKA